VSTVVAEVDVVRRVSERHRGAGAAKEPVDRGRIGRVAAQQSVIAQGPQVTGRRAWGSRRSLEGRLEVEALGALALLSGVEAAEEVAHLVIAEARQGQIERRPCLQVGEQAGEELLVPGSADPVEREAEDPGLLG
jgi:hypothetical protein